MKATGLVLTLLFSAVASISQADDYPSDSVCRAHNATSETVQIQGFAKKVVLCKFGLWAYVDRGSVQRASMSAPTVAVSSYQKNNDFAFNSPCTEFGARVLQA